MASEGGPVTLPQLPVPTQRYSNRVALKTILDRKDRGVGLVGERLVIGGWVKSSKEIKKEPAPAPGPAPGPEGARQVVEPKDVTCVELLQSRIPFLRSIIRVFGGNNQALRQNLELTVSKPPGPPPPSTAILHVSDGSCVTSLQVVVESSLAPPSQLMPVGTCIVAEGLLKQTSAPGKYEIELRAEKVLHTGVVDADNYILSKKRLPLIGLRDCLHLRQRTTTVASVMRIRSSLTIATYTFLQNHGFLCVQVPIITVTDAEGSCEKFQVTTLLGKALEREPKAKKTIDGVSLENLKAAVKEKSFLVEELKRSGSNKEALAAAEHDLKKTNQLVSQLEAKEKSELETSLRLDKVNHSEDFFSSQTYLTVSGRLHLESYACALGNVYSYGPTFRADKSDFPKQVAEMWMLELEMAFTQLEGVMNCAFDLLKFLFEWVLENSSEDIQFLSKRTHNTGIGRLQSIMTSTFEKISYDEAVDSLRKIKEKKFQSKVEWGVALTEEQVSYLADEIYKRPIIIYNHPKEVKPFNVRLNDDGRTVAAFDVIVPKGGTLIRGSQNEERFDMLDKRIKESGLPREQYEWYLDLRRHGTVKHSGFTLAFDLVVLFTTGLVDVREVIPFPRSRGKLLN